MTDPHSLLEREDSNVVNVKADGCGEGLRLYNFLSEVGANPRVSIAQFKEGGNRPTVWLSPAQAVVVADMLTEWLATRKQGA